MLLDHVPPKLFFYGILGDLAFFATFTIVVWFTETLAYGAAYWSLLSFLIVLVTLQQFKFAPSADTYQLKPRQHKVVVIAAILAAVFTFIGFIAVCITPPVNGPDKVAKPIFVLLGLVCLCFFLYVEKIASVTESSEVVALESEKKDQVSKVERVDVPAKTGFKGCCPVCCQTFLFLLVLLAAIHTLVFVVNEKFHAPGATLYEGQEEFLIEVEDAEIFFRCSGEGSPPVILNHGWSGNSLDFSWIQRAVSQTTRVCGFDRPGCGRSNKIGKLPRTSEQIAIETEAALTALNITGDVIFVGHSFAGFNMRKFENLFPGRIQGMVMIDTVNPNKTEECGDPEASENVNLLLYTFGRLVSDTGIFRILELVGLIDVATGGTGFLPEEVRGEYNQHLSRPGFYQTIIDERRVWGTSCASFPSTGPGKILNYTLSVVIPENGIFKDDLSGGTEQADLSPFGRFVIQEGDDAFHINSLFEEKYANIIIDEVLDVIETYRNNSA